MPEKKKKQAMTQAPATVSPPALASTTTTTPISPPPVLEESITKLIALATSSPNSPLGRVWKHAFEQGLQEGFKRGTALFKDMDVKRAFREGADQGQIVGILAEREEWETEGHGQWCFDKPLTCVLCDAGFCDIHVKLEVAVQVDSIRPPPPPSVNVAVQVEATHSIHSSASQTDPPPRFVNAEAQAQPVESKPITTTATILTPSTFDWSEDAASISVTPKFPSKQVHRDFSALRTTNPNPFGSLAHRNRRSRFFTDHHNISVAAAIWRHRAPP